MQKREGADEFESRLKKAVWGLGMETHGAQQVCRTGYSHSWVAPFSLPYLTGPGASSTHLT